jgi:exonuclease SbcD
MADALRIVHAADIHLDSPLRGLNSLGSRDLIDRLRRATSDAFRAMVDWCVQHGPDAVVLAGDIYDGDLQDYATGRFYVRELDRLHECGIPVFVVLGNHDAASVVTKTLQYPPNTHVFPTDAPSTVMLEDKGLAVHGQSYATKAVIDNLATGYPVRISGMVNVGVLHTSVAGYEGHDTYAPCSVDDLTSRGYEYFALGHIHQRQVLAEGLRTVAFSGNLQGRHIKETGPKGFNVVTLRADEPAEIEFVECSVARWEQVDIDLTHVSDWDAALAQVTAAVKELSAEAAGRPLVVRMTLSGSTPVATKMADRERVENEIGALCEREQVTLEKIIRRVTLPQQQQPLPEDEVNKLRALAVPSLLEGQPTRDIRAVLDESKPALAKLGVTVDFDEEEALEQAAQELLARIGG